MNTSLVADFVEFALAQQVLRFGKFTLKSGRVSPYFFNAGLFNNGAHMAELGKFYAQKIVESKLEYNVLFGPAYKGIPLVVATAIALYSNYGINAPFCFNRKETKDHGEGGNLVGSALKGKVLLIDDVITAGTAIAEAVTIIEQNNASLNAVLIALDRQEKSRIQDELSATASVAQKYNTTVNSICNLEQLIEHMAANKTHSEKLNSMRQYQKMYGA